MTRAAGTILLGLAMIVAGAFIVAGPEWGGAVLLVAGLLTLLVGVSYAVPLAREVERAGP